MGRVLVTGGAGFIGRRVVRALLARGDDVAVIDAMVRQAEPATPPFPARMTYGLLGDPDALNAALAGVDRVVHLAAVVGVGQSMYEASRYVRRNTADTVLLLEALRGRRIKRLVVASSMSCYGEGRAECAECGIVRGAQRTAEALADGHWEAPCEYCGGPTSPLGTTERDALRPASVYAITKRDQEEYCLTLGDAMGIPTAALRFFNVYGPGQALSNPYTGVAAIFACRLLNDKPPVLFEDGEQLRDFIHVDDIVSGVLAALDSDAVGSFNLGTGWRTSVRTVAVTLATALGRSIAPRVQSTYRVGDVRSCFADVTKARRVLGWHARTSPAEGLAALAEWLKGAAPMDGFARAVAELEEAGLLR